MAEELLQKHFTPYVQGAGEEYMNSDQLAHFRGILEAVKLQLMEDIERTVHTMQEPDVRGPTGSRPTRR